MNDHTTEEEKKGKRKAEETIESEREFDQKCGEHLWTLLWNSDF